MLKTLSDFVYMGGHGIYVFSAYGAMLILLFSQWLIPVRRWKRYLKQQKVGS